jgi:hypothetical protein
MPYKTRKQWERLHRSERLARRRELRRAEAAREGAQFEWRQRRKFPYLAAIPASRHETPKCDSPTTDAQRITPGSCCWL